MAPKTVFGQYQSRAVYLASTFPLVDAEFPAHERQTALAVDFFDQLCGGDEVACETGDFQASEVRFGNEWVPAAGWQAFGDSVPRPITEAEWRERFPELAQTEESAPDPNYTGPKDLFGHPIPTDLFGHEIRPKKKRKRK